GDRRGRRTEPARRRLAPAWARRANATVRRDSTAHRPAGCPARARHDAVAHSWKYRTRSRTRGLSLRQDLLQNAPPLGLAHRHPARDFVACAQTAFAQTIRTEMADADAGTQDR